MTSKDTDSGGVKASHATKTEQKGTSSTTGDVVTKGSPKKRRKVSHACIYCRRSHMTCDLERPCTRCIKRNIGHLCHDEPRDSAKKDRNKTEYTNSEEDPSSNTRRTTSESSGTPLDQSANPPSAGLNIAAPGLPQSSIADATSIAQPTSISAPQVSSLVGNVLNYNDWNPTSHNHFQDMHTFHPSYMFNTSEVSNEYSLLNDFLTDSLMDDAAMFGSGPGLFSDHSLTNTLGALSAPNNSFISSNTSNRLLAPPQAAAGTSISRPASGFPIEKAREAYYLTAADPVGTDTAEERMNKLLKAKYDAGLLKPFNYVKGYARLNQYMEKSLQSVSRMKILRQLDKFRPHFRERMQSLTDIELVRVEMWFERNLMEYDRVFASMAIPACCWRRTGEIFRGNKEMAELIHVPMENLRDGKLAIHEIMLEGSLVSYWENFGAIAFDSSQKAILTSCSLKNPDSSSKEPDIRCCFSFTIRRDPYNIPALIIGNFLPIAPPPSQG